jgi:nucleotide-binding universal stress UspA family protein
MSAERNEPTMPPTPLRVLFATDGEPDTLDAALVASRLASRSTLRLHVASAQGGHSSDALGKEALTLRVITTFSESLGDPAGWDLTVRDGQPAQVIADVAGEVGATLIVMGRGRSHTTPRMLGEALALQVARRTAVPILAVRSGRGGPAHTAVVAVDFSAASVVAARSALQVLEPDASSPRRLLLLHIATHDGADDDTLDPRTADQFERLEAMLRSDVADAVRIERRLERGPVAPAIQRVASREQADVVALGTHGRGFLERLFLGSVAITTLREAETSVLIAPAPALADRLALELELWEQVTLDRPEDWGEALDLFTRRNAGRRCRVERTESATGDVATEADAERLQAASWDPEERTVTLTLGEPGHMRRHSLLRVVSIELVGQPGPGDHALVVQHAGGRCLLTVSR